MVGIVPKTPLLDSWLVYWFKGATAFKAICANLLLK
jgi:hypothetical protein